jgi:hypothetical protein
MVQAVVLASVLGAILFFILQRGFHFSWSEPYASGYHLWAVRADENELRYLGCWDDTYAATEAAEDWLKDRKTVSVIVRKPGGSTQEFTAEDLQSSEGVCL